jgi:hypothetical protein
MIEYLFDEFKIFVDFVVICKTLRQMKINRKVLKKSI